MHTDFKTGCGWNVSKDKRWIFRLIGLKVKGKPIFENHAVVRPYSLLDICLYVSKTILLTYFVWTLQAVIQANAGPKLNRSIWIKVQREYCVLKTHHLKQNKRALVEMRHRSRSSPSALNMSGDYKIAETKDETRNETTIRTSCNTKLILCQSTS